MSLYLNINWAQVLFFFGIHRPFWCELQRPRKHTTSVGPTPNLTLKDLVSRVHRQDLKQLLSSMPKETWTKIRNNKHTPERPDIAMEHLILILILITSFRHSWVKGNANCDMKHSITIFNGRNIDSNGWFFSSNGNLQNKKISPWSLT